MRPTDLSLLRSPSHPTIAPDGSRVVYVVTRPDLDADAYRSQLWAVPADGSAPPRPFTHGVRDGKPAHSPDGRWIAFLRGGDGEPPQLHVMAADGGEPRALCRHPLGVASFEWAPDSRRIAYLARVPEEDRYGTAEGVPPEKEPPRRITRLKYRIDDVGFTFDRPHHVFVVDALAGGAEPAQLTDGEYDHLAVVWHPDGEHVAFVSPRHETRDTDPGRDIFVVPAAGGDARQVTDTSLPVQPSLAFSPDGETIFFAAQGSLDHFGRTTGIFSVPAAGGPPRRLTDEESVHAGEARLATLLPLLADADGVLTPVLRRGAVELARVPAGGGEPRALVSGRSQVHGFARADGVLAVVLATDTSSGEIAIVGDGGEVKPLTDHGSELAAAAALRPMEEIETTAPDGYPVHGWVVKPEGPGPHPTVLCVHGGPHAQFGYELFDEAQAYAAAGYAVVLGNPRGSSGYGNAHGRAVIGNMGGPDHADLTALLDAACADPALDDERVGIMGGSYGGFMTAWMTAHTDRFRTAIVERGFLAPDSFLGSSDIGSFFVDGYLGADPERQAAQSPLAKADRVRTPTLVIHSEQDWRCPVEQAQRYYVALKRNGVECELLLFPGEGHEMSRSGLPSHRVARFDAIIEWLGRYL